MRRKLLLAHGANVNARETWGEQTALMWAAAQKQPQMIRLLVQHGADVNARGVIRNWDRKVTAEGRPKDMNRGGFTPLLYAAREGCVACVDELLKGKADINLEDPHGTTPLVLALMNMKLRHREVPHREGRGRQSLGLLRPVPAATSQSICTPCRPASARTCPPPTPPARWKLFRCSLDRGANVNVQLILRPPVRSMLPGDRGAD